MEFCMAILVVERRAGLAEFTDAVVNRGGLQAMMDRVRSRLIPTQMLAASTR